MPEWRVRRSLPDAGVLLFGRQFARSVGAGEVARIRTAAPLLALVAVVDARREPASAAFELGCLGADALWYVAACDADPASSLRHAVETARVRVAERGVGALLGPGHPLLVGHALSHAMRSSDAMQSASTLARAIGATPSRLRTLFRAAGLPSPTRTLALCRILRASLLLEAGPCTTEHAGLEAGYSSGTAFRNACRRMLGMSPVQLKAAGGAMMIAARLASNRGRGSLIARERAAVSSGPHPQSHSAPKVAHVLLDANPAIPV